MRWLITSDWQTKYATLDASKRAHEQELAIIKKEGIKGHIDLGDLKDDFNPVDVKVIEFQQNRKQAIHEAVVHDITIMGNHDMLGQTNSKSNWFSLFDAISGNNIQKPGILELDNCIFSCLPFKRNHKELIEDAQALVNLSHGISKNLDNRRKILLFHCDVYGARWNNLAPFKSDSKITLDKLHTSFYDRCFGGHIHKHQHLSNNTMFVGNPFAADAGEIDQEKGFIIYDSDTNEVKRIRSKVPGLFSWAYVQKHKPRLIAGTKIKATVECSTSSNYHKDLDRLASKIENKYPECISYVIPKFITANKKESIEIDPNSSDYDKIAQYIRATVPDELRKKRKVLVQYVASMLGNATSSGIRPTTKLIFDNVYAENVLSFEKVSFSFRNRGILLVKGKNKDAVWNSNGSGKTNLLSLLPIGVSGRTFKDQKNDAWANDSNKERAIVNLGMRDEKNRTLKIVRGRRPTKLRFIVQGSDDSTGRRHNGKRETQGLIEETIGYNFDTLSNSVYIDSSLSNAFLTGTPADRSKLIHQFQNMDRFKIAKDKIGKELSVIYKQLTEADKQKDVAESLIEQLEFDIKKAEKKSKINLDKSKKNKLDAKENLKTLQSSHKTLSKTYKAMKLSVDKQLAKLKPRLDEIEKKHQLAGASANSKEEELHSFESLGNLLKCPQCTQVLTAEHKQVVVVRLKKAFGAKRTELKKLDIQIKVIEKDIDALNKPLENISRDLDNIANLLSRAEDRYKDLSEIYQGELDKANEEKSDVKSLYFRKRSLAATISRVNRVISHLQKDIRFIKYAQESMGRDGLPSFLNKLLCPLLNKAAEKYSEIFVDKEIQVLFDIDDGLITPSVMNTHGAKSIAGQSAGEKAWAGIICAFALREIAQPTNLLILDEPGNGLDTESAKMFGARLSRLKDRFETIIVVTHNESICSALDGDNSITVVKKNKKSVLK